MKYIRGVSLRVFKKYNKNINVDGIYYNIKSWLVFIKAMNQVTVGDTIYNPYMQIYEKVKVVHKDWEHCYGSIVDDNFVTHGKKVPYRILEITFTTETDYIVYDLFDDPQRI